MFSPTILLLAAVAGGVLILISRLLVRLEGKRQRHFRQSPDKIAIGFPVATPRTLEAFDREMLSIFMEYRARFRAIRKVKDEFGLSKAMMVKRADGSEFLLRYPNSVLHCDVVLGTSLAGAGFTPGSAIYWLPLPGEALEKALIKRGVFPPGPVAAGSLQLEADADRILVRDSRKDAIPQIDIGIGTPLVLKLDKVSEDRMQRVLADEAPPRGKSKKVRLFGGLRQVDGQWMIVPLRQEANQGSPSEGYALHPLSSLMGVVVAKAQDKAFTWMPPTVDDIEQAAA